LGFGRVVAGSKMRIGSPLPLRSSEKSPRRKASVGTVRKPEALVVNL